MTENEWLVSADPKPMLDALGERLSKRKLRLLACAFFRHLYAPSHPLNSIIEVGEKLADGTASGEELRAARSLARGQEPYQMMAIQVVVSDATSDMVYLVLGRGRARMHALRVRELFGNPFRPVSVDPTWITSDVLALATGIYQDQAFDRLPILADALQDAGCDSEDVLNHLRSDGPHVLGCWSLDLVLGKS